MPQKPRRQLNVKAAKARDIIEFIETWTKEITSEVQGEAGLDRFRRQREPDHLWAVMGAVRGPDNEADGLKGKTTGPIRGQTFPYLSDYCMAYQRPAEVGELKEICSSRVQGLAVEYHFSAHVSSAVHAIEAMGLDVEEDPQP